MKKGYITLAVLLLLFFSLTPAALAEAGSGDGSGGGSGQLLALDSSSVPNGASDVAQDVKITLTFTKNVVNMAVKDNNMTCFTLADAEGAAVPIDILMGDDQVDPTVKRIVDIKPKGPLSPGTSYTLTISKNMTSKSGDQMAADVVLSFTTVAAPQSPSAPVPPLTPTPAPSAEQPPSSSPPSPSPSVPIVKPTPSPSASAPAADTAASPSSVPPSAIPSAETQNPDSGADSGDSPDAGGNSAVPYILTAAGLAIAAGIAVIALRKKK